MDAHGFLIWFLAVIVLPLALTFIVAFACVKRD